VLARLRVSGDQQALGRPLLRRRSSSVDEPGRDRCFADCACCRTGQQLALRWAGRRGGFPPRHRLSCARRRKEGQQSRVQDRSNAYAAAALCRAGLQPPRELVAKNRCEVGCAE
jgi:hypothetical protein